MPRRPVLPAPRSLDDAAHEAAHAVVGVALGLRVEAIALTPLDPEDAAYVSFRDGVGAPLAWAVMYAAGVAWERRRAGGGAEAVARYAHEDVGEVALLGLDLGVCEALAGAMLETRGAVHWAVTRALVERNLTGRDLDRLALAVAGRGRTPRARRSAPRVAIRSR